MMAYTIEQLDALLRGEWVDGDLGLCTKLPDEARPYVYQLRDALAKLERVKAVEPFYEPWPDKAPFLSKAEVDAAIQEQE